jgi:hypothetical protein
MRRDYRRSKPRSTVKIGQESVELRILTTPTIT